MSWEARLLAELDELEQQAEALYAAELDAELVDRARSEYARVTLASRLMACVGEPVALDVSGVGVLRGRLTRVAETWLLLGASGQDWVVALGAVTSARTSIERSVPEVAWSPLARLGLGSLLRRLAEAHEHCVVRRRDGRAHEGTVDRVGHDFVEVREGEGPGARLTLVAFAAIAAVGSPELG